MRNWMLEVIFWAIAAVVALAALLAILDPIVLTAH